MKITKKQLNKAITLFYNEIRFVRSVRMSYRKSLLFYIKKVLKHDR